jgi:DNA-binding transcriptional ArsR family regulator
MDVKRFETGAEQASELVKSLAHPVRLRILCALAGKECSVTMLAETAGAGMSTISRHLALLRKDHIVKARRARQTIVYSLSDANIGKIIALLTETFCDAATSPKSQRKKNP